jgi:hypothetical protein
VSEITKTLDWRIAAAMDARNELRDVRFSVPDMSPAYKACLAAEMAAEIAWKELEDQAWRYPPRPEPEQYQRMRK